MATILTTVSLQTVDANNHSDRPSVPGSMCGNVEQDVTDDLLNYPGSGPVGGELPPFVHLESRGVEKDQISSSEFLPVKTALVIEASSLNRHLDLLPHVVIGDLQSPVQVVPVDGLVLLSLTGVGVDKVDRQPGLSTMQGPEGGDSSVSIPRCSEC